MSFFKRKDATKITNLSGMHYILNDLKPNRCDSDVYINQKLDVTNLVNYINKLKKENPDIRITYFHAFSMALAKLLYNRPYLNRFIANHNFYQRNEIKLSFVAKIEFEDDSEELLCVIPVSEKDTLIDISKLISEKVTRVRGKETKSDTNNLIDLVGHMPNIIRRPIVGVVKILDRYGLLPASFINDNIYYSSIIMSNLGSIHCGAIYHNLTNFGTNSILITMGEIHKEVVVDEKGKEHIRDICEFGANIDERIADGLYFAKSIQLVQYILDNPELLEEPANTKIEINN